jgi:hypothetical protein
MLPTSVMYYIQIDVNLPFQLHSFPTTSHILSVANLFLHSLWSSCHRIGLHWTSDIKHSVLNLFLTLSRSLICRLPLSAWPRPNVMQMWFILYCVLKELWLFCLYPLQMLLSAYIFFTPISFHRLCFVFSLRLATIPIHRIH